jgi:hypothetical protein
MRDISCIYIVQHRDGFISSVFTSRQMAEAERMRRDNPAEWDIQERELYFSAWHAVGIRPFDWAKVGDGHTRMEGIR